MDFVFQIAILILSVVIHEVSHGYSAYLLGDRTAYYQGRLSMNPVRHLDPFGSFIVPLIFYSFGGFILGWAKPVPYNPFNLKNQRWGEAIVAFAGPLSNILIAIIFGLMIRFLYPMAILPESFFMIAQFVVLINIILAIFNLVPVPPLDGSKILFSVLPYHMQEVRYSLEKYSIFLVLLFVFFLWRFLYPVITYIFGLLTGLNF